MTNMATPLPHKIYNFGKYFIAYNYDELVCLINAQK